MAAIRSSTTSPPETHSASSTPHPAPPTNAEIEAVIQAATSNCSSTGPIPGRDTRTQLFVGNLPYRVRWQDLKDLFRKSGTVLRADVSLTPDNRSRGYGTVLLGTAEDAGRAVDMYNGFVWQGRTLEVRPDRLPPDFEAMNNMMANPCSATSAGFHAPSPLQLQFPPSSSSSTGTMPLSSFSLGDNRSDMSSPFGSAERPLSSNGNGNRHLFVGNLPFHCQWQDLKDLFRRAGQVIRADVVLGPDGRSRGFGTVTFANELDADKAVAHFNGLDFNGRKLKVHHDKFNPNQSQTAWSAPGSQVSYGFENHPNQLSIPLGPRTFDLGSISGPSSPLGGPPTYLLHPQPQSSTSWPVMLENDLNATRFVTPPPQQGGRLAPGSSLTQPTASAEPMQPSSSTTNTQHSHPGPISLPPMRSGGGFPVPLPHNISPLHHPLTPTLGIAVTPHGLPPITPSMPSFSFMGQPEANGGHSTPPISMAMFSPAMGISPDTFSPGTFWGRPGHMGNSMINAAVGAPVMLHQGGPGSPGTPTFYGSAPPSQQMEYFPTMPPAQAQEGGYFPQMNGQQQPQRPSRLAHELVRMDSDPLDDEKGRSPASAPSASDNDTDLSLRDGDARSSVATSVSDADEAVKQMDGMTLEGRQSRSHSFSSSTKASVGVHRTHSDGRYSDKQDGSEPHERSKSSQSTEGQRGLGFDIPVR